MKADHLDKIATWFLEQIAVVKTETAGEEEHSEEGALADLALRRVFGLHFDEIRYDRDLVKEVYALVSEKATPSALREIAEEAREQGKSGLGYYLEVIADYRDGQPV